MPSNFRAFTSTGSGFSRDTYWGNRGSYYDIGSTQTFQAADLNGDGLPDLIYINSNYHIHVLLNTGSGFGSDNTIPGFTVQRATNSYFIMADVNGDGIPDLIYDNGYEFCVIPGDGKGGFTAGFSAPRKAAYYSGTTFQVADMNGDGLADIVYVDGSYGIHVLLSTGSGFQTDTVWGYLNPSANDPFASPDYYQLVDMNGDGLADLIYTGWDQAFSSAYIYLLKSRGCINPSDKLGFESQQLLATLTVPYFQPIDLNGDGLPDLAYSDINNTEARVMFNTGAGLGAKQLWTGNLYNCVPEFGDLNGEGISDLITEATSGHFRGQPSNGPVPDLITGISNGLGGSYTIQYQPSSLWTSNQMLPFILQTVYSITANDGNGNCSTTQFSYSGGYYSRAKKEFRGFTDVWNTLPDQKTTVHSTYAVDDIYKGLLLTQTTTGTDGTSVAQTNIYQDTPPAQGVDFPWLYKTRFFAG